MVAQSKVENCPENTRSSDSRDGKGQQIRQSRMGTIRHPTPGLQG